MAKMELIEARYGGLLVRLGAFPVRRGESDAEALETATVILRQGGLLALFPEGTRVRDPDELGHPRRGAGRLALESGAPLLPCAITGTERLFVGPIPKPRRVQVGSPSRSPLPTLRPHLRLPREWSRARSGPRWRASSGASERAPRLSRRRLPPWESAADCWRAAGGGRGRGCRGGAERRPDTGLASAECA
jgi:hypothetical protein